MVISTSRYHILKPRQAEDMAADYSNNGSDNYNSIIVGILIIIVGVLIAIFVPGLISALGGLLFAIGVIIVIVSVYFKYKDPA